jgi:hypothetical protein
MRRLLAPLASGALVAALLYGLLAAAERKIPEPEDPWLDGWIGEGLKAEFRALSTEPAKDAMASDARSLFKTPEFAGTLLRGYIVQNTSAQVVRLPMPGLAPDIPEGRSMDFQFKPKGNKVHVCRSGRSILFVASQSRFVFMVGQLKTSRKMVEELFDSFEETARRYP